MSSEDSPLDELIQSAEEQKERTAEELKKSRQVREKLNDKLDELFEEDILDSEEFNRALNYLEDSQYGKVREIVAEAEKGTRFDDEDMQEFADAFSETFEELEAEVEKVRNQLMDLDGSVDRSVMISYIYGSTGLNKGDVEKIFDVLDKYTSSGVDSDKLARALRGYNSSLNLDDTKKVIEKMQERGEA